MTLHRFICRKCRPACISEAAEMSKDEAKRCTLGKGIKANFVMVL